MAANLRSRGDAHISIHDFINALVFPNIKNGDGKHVRDMIVSTTDGEIEITFFSTKPITIREVEKRDD